MLKNFKKKVNIIIIIFNEKNYIEKIIKKIITYIKFSKQIIVADDYSSDGTRKKINFYGAIRALVTILKYRCFFKF